MGRGNIHARLLLCSPKQLALLQLHEIQLVLLLLLLLLLQQLLLIDGSKHVDGRKGGHWLAREYHLMSLQLQSVRLRLRSLRQRSLRLESLRLESLKLESWRLEYWGLPRLKLDCLRLCSLRLESLRLEHWRLHSRSRGCCWWRSRRSPQRCEALLHQRLFCRFLLQLLSLQLITQFCELGFFLCKLLVNIGDSPRRLRLRPAPAGSEPR